jgi:alkanesulfonate monooxygenase SsuD/methylene tetrahydromethanopterin reductase-like flavin-dependent oxidoreductase (luciferase family)
MGAASPAAIARAARIADGLNPIAFSLEALEATVNSFRSAAQAAGRDPSTLMIMVRANVPITANPLIGAILAPGERTVAAILRVMGLQNGQQFQNASLECSIVPNGR